MLIEDWRFKEMIKTLDRSDSFLKKNSKLFSSKFSKKRRCDASGDPFCKFHKSLIIVKYTVSKICVTVDLTCVTSQDYVIMIN